MKVNFSPPGSQTVRLPSRKARKMVTEGASPVHSIQHRTRSQACGIECPLLILQVTSFRVGSAAPLLPPLACFILLSISLHSIGHPLLSDCGSLPCHTTSALPQEGKNSLNQHGKSLPASLHVGTRTCIRECETPPSWHNIFLYIITTN